MLLGRPAARGVDAEGVVAAAVAQKRLGQKDLPQTQASFHRHPGPLHVVGGCYFWLLLLAVVGGCHCHPNANSSICVMQHTVQATNIFSYKCHDLYKIRRVYTVCTTR